MPVSPYFGEEKDVFCIPVMHYMSGVQAYTGNPFLDLEFKMC